ncbi:uncharacterized protein cubi_01482 [Cryptosporidium ubiquitum]|uniref:Uncharacterized protein n=1 Tax=Cryptosporidium ubiquitum TaxID=857276 RepID=A0A1J4MH24_9CRYT|nr:uncharacterized protein cubi_01482 [Cryptosporidium ubiquitum]OII72149.1 hypothetical protein cubi_01482 [Cryptosporidium ubiquitum]
MDRLLNQITIASIPETIECDLLKKKDGKFFILESKNDISSAKELFKGLRNGLKSNCSIQNHSNLENKLKDLVLRISSDPDFTLNDNVDDDVTCLSVQTKEDIMQILEKSRQLNKENIQIIDGMEILLSGQGGRPFAKLDKDFNVKKEIREFEPERRIQILHELDKLLISTLKCTAEVDRLNQINANSNINHCPNSSVSKSIKEMKDSITNLYINSFNGTHDPYE